MSGRGGDDDDDDGRAFEAAVEAESVRHFEAMVSLIDRWPSRRRHAIARLLGDVIAFADTFGVNVEGFVADLRRAEPKPPELIPPHEAKARGRG